MNDEQEARPKINLSNNGVTYQGFLKGRKGKDNREFTAMFNYKALVNDYKKDIADWASEVVRFYNLDKENFKLVITKVG